MKKRNESWKNKKNDNYSNQSNKIMPVRNIGRKFFLALCVRLGSVILTQTYFVPDEYWQSTELAHRQTFGYGYLTWEWRLAIRSYLYPLLFQLYFALLRCVSLDTVTLVVYGPHVIQAVVTSIADVSVYKTSLALSNSHHVAELTFYNLLSAWFVFYTGSRTLSNTIEMCLNAITFSCYFYHNNFFLTLLFGGLSCIIRPTSVLIWAPFVLKELLSDNLQNTCKRLVDIFKAFPLLIVIMFGVDFYFYGRPVVSHWNFLKFNVLQSMSGFYGTHPVHWYVTPGLPTILGVDLLYFAIGVFYCRNNVRCNHLLWIAMFYVLFHSVISHKEFRFLLPVVPILWQYVGRGMQYVSLRLAHFKQLFLASMVVNVVMAGYFSCIHQRGTIDVMTYLQGKDHVMFLMPCHSTPYYSYLHSNVTLRFLTCEPPVTGIVDEANKFYKHPENWLRDNKAEVISQNYLVLFNTFSQDTLGLIKKYGFQKVQSFFHTHLPEGRVGSRVLVFQKLLNKN